MAQQAEMSTIPGPLQRPFTEDRRMSKRRVSEDSGSLNERRSRQERRLDANWRYALIRRQLNG